MEDSVTTLVAFFVAEAKHLTKKKLKEEEPIQVHGLRRWPIVAGNVWQQGPEGAGNTVSTVGKERWGEGRGTLVLSWMSHGLLFILSGTPAPGMAPPTLRGSLPFSNKPLSGTHAEVHHLDDSKFSQTEPTVEGIR